MDSILVFVSDGGLVDGGSGVVDGGGSCMVDGSRSSVVDGGGLVRGGFVSGGLGVLSFTRVGNIGDVTTVTISNVVGHSLKTAVGESDGVASLGRISITRLIGIVAEIRATVTDWSDCWRSQVSLGSTVVVIDSVLVAVDGGLIIRGLMIRRAVGRGRYGAGGGSDDTGENDESLELNN